MQGRLGGQTRARSAARMRLTCGAFEASRLCCYLGWLLLARLGVESSPRYLLYPPPRDSATKVQLIFGLGLPMELDVSTIVGYVIKCNYDLPYNASYEPARRERSSDGGGALRAGIYRMIEAAVYSGSRARLDGRACLLRSVCEAAATPFATRNSLLSQLLYLLFTPSSTAEPIDREYLAAERIGARAAGPECAHAFAECRANFLEYFSEIR